MIGLVPALAAALAASSPEPGMAAPRPARAGCPNEASGTPAPTQDNLYKQRVADSVFHRTGFVLGVNVGVSGCDTGDFCRGRGFWARTPDGLGGDLSQRPGPGPSVSFELGLRPIPYVEALAFGHFGYHPTHIEQPAGFPEGEPFTFTASGGLAVNARPVAFTRFDPYIGLGIGYHVYRSDVSYTRASGFELNAQEQLVRLLLRPTIGLDVFVARNVSIGPRFEYDLFAGGQYCNQFDLTDDSGNIQRGGGCNDVSFLETAIDREGDAAEGSLPRFWRLGISVRASM